MKSSFTIKYHHDIVVDSIKVNLSVVQKNITLYQRTLDLRCFFSPLQIDFDFEVPGPLELIFETDSLLISTYPLYIDRIEIDDLFSIPFVSHKGELTTLENHSDVGNCLYAAGSLTYKLELPICNYTIFK